MIYKTIIFNASKTGRNDSKFSIGKYHINTIEIIKLFQVNIFMPVTKFPRLIILLSLISSGDFSKKLIAKIGDFALGKKGREKTQMVKVAKSCHQVTQAQKNVTKKRELQSTFTFKVFKCE